MVEYNVVKRALGRAMAEYKESEIALLKKRRKEEAMKCRNNADKFKELLKKFRKYKGKKMVTVEELREIDGNLVLIIRAIKKRINAMEKEFKDAEKRNCMRECLRLAKFLQESENTLAVLEKEKASQTKSKRK